MKLTIKKIKNKVAPIAKRYSLNAVYIFGSYARGDANENSDIDILIDREGSTLKGMLDMGNLYNDLCETLKKEIDLITIQTLKQKSTKKRLPYFIENIESEKIQIYG